MLVIIAKATGSALTFKCCPIGSVLNHELDCINKTIETADFFGFNIASDQMHHLPNCEKEFLRDIALNYEIETINGLASGSCIDFMENESEINIHLITCVQKQSTDFKNIFKLKKCCPNKEHYNVNERKCEHSIHHDSFVDLLPVSNGSGPFETGKFKFISN